MSFMNKILRYSPFAFFLILCILILILPFCEMSRSPIEDLLSIWLSILRVLGLHKLFTRDPSSFLNQIPQSPYLFLTNCTFSISPRNEICLAFVIYHIKELSKVFSQCSFGISEKFAQKFIVVDTIS